MKSKLINLSDFENLNDDEKISFKYFNNLNRNEKLTLINFKNENKNKLIFPGNPGSNIKSERLFI